MLGVDPAADGAADHLLVAVLVAGAALRRLGERGEDLRLDVVEHLLVLGEAAGLDLGPDDDPAGLHVQCDEDGDEPLLGEDAAVLEVGIRDRPDTRPVDVDEPDVELADDLGDPVPEVDDDPVLADEVIRVAFQEAAVNRLTNPALDPWGKIAEVKYCAVRVEKT